MSPNLLKWCPNLVSAFHAFHRCDHLIDIPQGLFDHTPNLENITICFKSCTSLETVPSNLFDKCKKIRQCYACFCGGQIDGDVGYEKYMKIQSNVPPLWTRPYGSLNPSSQYATINNYTYYCTNCTEAKNYRTAIQLGWA